MTKRKRRRMKIRLKWKRTKKLKDLKEKYIKAKSEKGKEEIEKKFRKTAPYLDFDKYIKS